MPKSSIATRTPSRAPFERAQGSVRVVHDRAFGHLEDERVRRYSRLCQCDGQVGSKPGFSEVTGKDVDGDVGLGGRMPSPRMAAPSRQARRSTQRSRASISPLSSAATMNSSGGTTPRSGCVHRHSASTPSSRPVPRSTTGW